MKVPFIIPDNGFYYHYKHEPHGPVNNYAYEVIGVGVNTEDDCRPEDASSVIYRPLYEPSIYDAGKFFYLKALQLWMSDKVVDDISFPRYKEITDPEVILELTEIKRKMYGA